MFETAMLLELMEKLRDKCHQNSKDKGFWDEGRTVTEVSSERGDNLMWHETSTSYKTKPWNLGEKLALVHSELSELFEAWRKGIVHSDKDITILDPSYKPLPGQIQDGTRRITAIEEEVADVFIRMFDLCGKLDIDVGRVILAKMEYNKGRPHLHGGRKA